MENAFNKLFWLSVLLIIAFYFVGVATDAATLFAGIKSLGQVFTGRDANNKPANYPSGATLTPTTLAAA